VWRTGLLPFEKAIFPDCKGKRVSGYYRRAYLFPLSTLEIIVDTPILIINELIFNKMTANGRAIVQQIENGFKFIEL